MCFDDEGLGIALCASDSRDVGCEGGGCGSSCGLLGWLGGGGGRTRASNTFVFGWRDKLAAVGAFTDVGVSSSLEIFLSGGGLLDGLSRVVSGCIVLVFALVGERSFLFLEEGRRSPPPF